MKCTDSHEWITASNQIGTVGITTYAQKELGEIVYISLPEVGQRVKQGEEVCVIESTKAAVDIYSPVGGKVIKINSLLVEDLEAINVDPEKEGWLYAIEIDDLEEYKGLMTLEEYKNSL